MHLTLWPSPTEPSGGHFELDWSELVRFCASPVVVERREALQGWSPVRFTGNRRKLENVELVSAIVLDVDDAGGRSFEDVCSCFPGTTGVVHTSFRHAPGATRCRIVLRCSRDMTADEHARVWRAVNTYAASHGLVLDAATKDASRFWYVPGRRPDGLFEWRELFGVPIDVDAVLAAVPGEPSSPAPAPATPATTAPAPATFGDTPRRRAMAAALGAAWPEKGRHEAQLALAGALRSEGWPENEALEFLCAVCRTAGNEDRTKRLATIRHTYDRADGAALTGWTRLKSHVDPVLVDAARKALARDADTDEQLERRLAELAAERAARTATPAKGPAPGTDTVIVGPFTFRVGGLDAAQEPLTFVVDPLIGRGDVTMFVAHGNSLKTWLAFSIALAIASGRPWLGRFPTKQGKVAILDYESGEFEVTRRLKLLGASDSELGERLLRCSYSGADLTKSETWLALAEAGLDLLIIDSFNAASPNTDENDARAALMLQHAGRFAEMLICTVIVIHHARKGEGGDERETVRGSTAIYGACDRVYRFGDLEKKDVAPGSRLVLTTMYSIKDGAGQPPPPVRVELSDSGLRWVEGAEKPKDDEPSPENNREIVMTVVRANPAGVSKGTLLDAMLGRKQTKVELLAQMILAGDVQEVRGRGAEKLIMMPPNAR